jgi:isocitrate dehydrogenase kinase/phosphatase
VSTSRAHDRAVEDAAAAVIADTFHEYVSRFRQLTRRARAHFETQDWQAMQRDSARRFDLYTEAVNEGLAKLLALLGPRAEDRPSWTALREAFAARVATRWDVELAETFFNSFTRRIFHTIGVDPAVEYVTPGMSPRWLPVSTAGTTRFFPSGSLDALVRALLGEFRFAPGWEDVEQDAARVARRIEAALSGADVQAIDLVRAEFFRGKAAYLVGRVLTDRGDLPLLIALANPRGRIVVDAVLLNEDEVSIVFSFARSYFLVDMDSPRDTVLFLKAIMPRKPVAELYTAVGWNKHGKTELYRSVLAHLAVTEDQFERAPGQRGMVMTVFTLPRFDVVFKVIKDTFDYPKTVTRQEVRDKYSLVFRHDRAGRLVDAQEFEHLEFDAGRFDPDLLDELTHVAKETVRIRAGSVVIDHLYTERRLRPLDIYLKEASPAAARDAVLEYGQVLRDLAATNIFPGDMLLKNFGVTRHGRLIFYDYDELTLLTDLNFRTLPEARGDAEEVAGEPWFYVGDKDIFPEEFRPFLGLSGELLEVFLARHGELLHAEFWQRMQERHRRGEILDIYPYRSERRLRGADEESNR